MNSSHNPSRLPRRLDRAQVRPCRRISHPSGRPRSSSHTDHLRARIFAARRQSGPAREREPQPNSAKSMAQMPVPVPKSSTRRGAAVMGARKSAPLRFSRKMWWNCTCVSAAMDPWHVRSAIPGPVGLARTRRWAGPHISIGLVRHPPRRAPRGRFHLGRRGIFDHSRTCCSQRVLPACESPRIAHL